MTQGDCSPRRKQSRSRGAESGGRLGGPRDTSEKQGDPETPPQITQAGKYLLCAVPPVRSQRRTGCRKTEKVTQKTNFTDVDFTNYTVRGLMAQRL